MHYFDKATHSQIASTRLVALVLAIAISGYLAAPVPRKTKPSRTDYFSTQVGSKWIYQNTQNADWKRTDVVTSVEVESWATTINIGTIKEDGGVEHREKMLLSSLGLFKLDTLENGSQMSTRYLKFPLRVGDMWDCYARGRIGSATYVGIEDVEVPAGRFRAAKVVVKWPSRGIETAEVTGWFAAEVGAVKYQFGEGDAAEVLHSFTPGQN